jgi:hypothetical protein
MPSKINSNWDENKQSANPGNRVSRWYIFITKILIWVYFGGPWNGKCW